MLSGIKGNRISVIQIIRGCSGLTVSGLVGVIIILAVVIAIAFSIYSSSINKARIAMAENALNDIQKDLKGYYRDNGRYPASIDFALNCIDENGHVVFDSSLCSQLKSDLTSIESYKADSTGYIMTVRAKDNKNTIVTLDTDKITMQGN